MAKNELTFTIRAKNLFTRSLRKMSGQVQRIARNIASGFRIAIKAGAILGGTILAVGSRMVKMYRDQAAQEAKLANVLKATGYAAGFTASQLKKQAAELQRVTGVSDNVIISMQSMLATFRNVQGDTFTRATEAILDMGEVFRKAGADASLIEQQVIQVGKALNDPIRGVTALQRVGITFTQTQRDQIRYFQETNQIAQAQGIILRELEAQFGGAARGADKNVIAWNRLKETLGDGAELIGEAITETGNFTDIWNDLSDTLEKLYQDGYIELWAEDARRAIEKMLPVFSRVPGMLAATWKWSKRLFGTLPAYMGGYAGQAGQGIGAKIGAGASAVVDLWNDSGAAEQEQRKTEREKRRLQIVKDITAEKNEQAEAERQEMTVARQKSQFAERELRRQSALTKIKQEQMTLEKRRAEIQKKMAYQARIDAAVAKIDRRIYTLERRRQRILFENRKPTFEERFTAWQERRQETRDARESQAKMQARVNRIYRRWLKSPESVSRRNREYMQDIVRFQKAEQEAKAIEAEKRELEKRRDKVQENQLQELRKINEKLIQNLQAAGAVQ